MSNPLRLKSLSMSFGALIWGNPIPLVDEMALFAAFERLALWAVRRDMLLDEVSEIVNYADHRLLPWRSFSSIACGWLGAR